ncbi:ESX secretion-associated protein EspG [Mycobacterium sherrisii]|uniref:ESX secretion-associated protein EspG n=1 Tax=Mycobacterium sherrisii TaxID=243061 RepID=A0A1E3T043_9MYCO|nr:ESX secretion-associated protein EspG [Mycobacterium sherrisii]MCV7031013.1 ESX secretion-associated protein EspG [Mycobacterium sherrisii]MEC4764352.1 ESX secretion-associated protein EspG [Mycobacterium sherrisii]ODR07710.1 hypothetical protein BHQ21_08245 [Mycobacterium sherrisii]ORW84219.1 hypothetical protein AWC25_25345 [Mycobacterium sherrisii]
MSGVLLDQVGTIDLVDLNAISQFFGRDFMPYPFMFTQGPRFATRDEASFYTSTVPDRFNHGDLSIFAECMSAYESADIRVECRVQFIPTDTPSQRLIACRAGHLGFFAEQRPGDDLVDIYSVSPYDLGAAISDAISLTQPGTHPEIVIPEYVPRAQAEFDHGDFVVYHKAASTTEIRVPASEVTAYSTIQCHWRPTRRWGLDRGKRALVWVRIRDDGEYIYAPDPSCARPMTKAFLSEQIDRLIAEDVAILREFRRG